MKTLALIFLCVSVVCDIPSISELENSLSVAFENVTSHLFRLETRMFINNYGVHSDTMTWLMIERLNEKGMPFKLQNLEIDANKIQLKSSAFLTFDSFEKLRKFNQKLFMTSDFHKPLQLFVYCQTASVDNIESLALDVSRKPSNVADQYSNYYFRRDLQDIIQYEYFLYEEEKFVRLMTFLWYSPGKCGKLHLQEVNSFDKLTEKWQNDKFVFEKLKSFHNCEIIFYPDLRMGFPDVIITEMRKHLNYQTVSAKRTFFKKTQVDASVRDRCYDSNYGKAKIGDPGFNTSHSDKVEKPIFISWPVEYRPIRLAVPPSDNYSEYEKLVMPFDFFTWALIAMTFVASFATILILYFVKRSIRDFIIGSNISTPALNVIQIFFGISQAVLPQRNFARYLTMLFILFCLIIRTAWQGKMYEFMTKDIAKPEVQTVDEMIEKGYTFYMEEDFTKKYPFSKITTSGKIVTVNFFTTDLTQNLFEPNFKKAVQMEPMAEALLAKQTNGQIEKRLRKEILYIEMCGLGFARHHHFVGIFEAKSQQLFNAGIIKHFEDDWASRVIRTQRLKHLIIEGPRVLTMHKLEPGFVIWSTSLVFTLIAFLMEWLVTLKDYFVSKYILQAFFRVQNKF